MSDLSTETKTLPDLEENRKIKGYGVIVGFVSLALQHGIYFAAHCIASLVGITPFLPKIEAIDGLIPIIPIFIIPYVWAYAFWCMTPMVVSKCKFDHFLNHLASYLFACLFGALILIFAPTYMDRVAEGLTTFPKTDFLHRLMSFWYSLDGGDLAYNLLPSFHCINSTVCFLATFRRKEIPLWYRIYSLVLTLLIYAATIFVKQHYICDVFAGIAIGVLSYVLCTKLNAGRIFLRPIAFFKSLFAKKEK